MDDNAEFSMDGVNDMTQINPGISITSNIPYQSPPVTP